MTTLCRSSFERRPIVVVEDHLGDLNEIISLISKKAPGLLGLLTAVGLVDRAGDTRQVVEKWLQSHPAMQVAANLPSEDAVGLLAQFPARFRILESATLRSSSPTDLCEALAEMARPGGLFLQDIFLDSLAFIPHDKMRKSYREVGFRVRNLVPRGDLQCWLMSNKQEFEGDEWKQMEKDRVTFLNKKKLEKNLIPNLRAFFLESMPLHLKVTHYGRLIYETAIGEQDLDEVMAELDLVVWHSERAVQVGGRLVKKGQPRHRPTRSRGKAWVALIKDLFSEGKGVAISRFGKWRATEDAGKAELSNRGHTLAGELRAQLINPDDPVFTRLDNANCLSAQHRIGWVTAGSFFG